MKNILFVTLFFLGYSINAQDSKMTKDHDKPMIHHVYFTLKNSDSVADEQKLKEGLETLTSIKGVNSLTIGVPAPTVDRDVIASDWDVSLIIYFESVSDQDAYQVDPLHLRFIDRYSHLWSKVVVYDLLVD